MERNNGSLQEVGRDRQLSAYPHTVPSTERVIINR